MSKEIRYLVEEKNNEIDLLLFYSFFKNNIKLIGLLILFFTTLGLAYIYTRPIEYYASYPIAMHKDVSSAVLNDLKNATKFSKSEYQTIVKLTNEEAESLNFTTISNIVLGMDKHTAVINISAKKPDHMISITEKLIFWAENNKTIQSKFSLKKEKLNSLIEKADKQIAELEILKDRIIKQGNNSNENIQISFSGEYEIYKSRQEVLEEIESLDPILNDGQFYLPSKPKLNSKTIAIFFTLVISSFLAFAIAFIMRFRFAK